jgi:hypothetical protein
VELDSIPQYARERMEQIGAADLVVGILGVENGQVDAVATIREALQTLPGVPRTVVIQNNGAPHPPLNEAQAADHDSTAEEPPPFVVSWRLSASDPLTVPVQSVSEAYDSIFAAAEKLEARACCVVASNLESFTSRWISQLTQPLLEMDFDLVTPCYGHHKFEGLINSSIICPLSRALYGKRIQNPMGPDLGLSGRLLQKVAGTSPVAKAAGNRMHPLASIAPSAIDGNFRICESHLGTRLYPATDWTNLSNLLAQILDPVFLGMERYAASWQKARVTQPVAVFGEPTPLSAEMGAVDVHRMIESFQLGTRNLQDIWSLVLPPHSLLGLKKLAVLSPGQFRMPDELWVRIVYDFALGHRQRAISRDHLLRAMTPLYLGWVASYALELETAEGSTVEQRLERLALAYEAAKPYLVSRWRWPDRFNP